MRIHPKQKGFTLLELVLVIVMVGVISVGITKIYAQVLSILLVGQNTSNALSQGRVGMERMIKEIRATRSAVDISVFTSSEYTFIDTDGNSINYKLSGGNLVRNNIALADGISSLTFAYYDKSSNVTAAAANIAYIKISMNVTQKNTNFTLNSGVYLRDLSS